MSGMDSRLHPSHICLLEQEEDAMSNGKMTTESPKPSNLAEAEVIYPGDDGYDEARSVFNAMIDKRPTLIVRPTTASQVIDSVNLARERDLPVAVRCGGH